MMSLAGLIGGYIIALLVGKRVMRVKHSTYFILALVALMQVAIVLYELYTKQIPQP